MRTDCACIPYLGIPCLWHYKALPADLQAAARRVTRTRAPR